MIQTIIKNAIRDTSPYKAVYDYLSDKTFDGKTVVLSIGKAAAPMATAAFDALGDNISDALVITKYDHAKDLPEIFNIIEAGHPVPDENSINAAKSALKKVENLCEQDTVIVLLSGGGSALFEYPVIPFDEYMKLVDSLLKSGCTINEMNIVRKHLSKVKGGNFAKACRKAHVLTLILSDVLGDKLDIIASGPTVADQSTIEEAKLILQKYNIEIPELIETPKSLDNSTAIIVGNIDTLCNSVKNTLEEYGYKTVIYGTNIEGEARDVAKILCNEIKKAEPKTAIIMCGETTVTVKGNGKGGRNQELALAASIEIAGSKDIQVFAFGSDGTDGPTDAAGGIIDGTTAEKIFKISGKNAKEYLENNDSYNALKSVDSLIITGATGTNVNDVYCATRR
jgi:hydroxypyruvate reductase